MIAEVRPTLDTIWPAEGAAEMAMPTGWLAMTDARPGEAAPTTTVSVRTSVPRGSCSTVTPSWSAVIVRMMVCSPGWSGVAVAVATLGLLLVIVTSSGVGPVCGADSTRTVVVEVCDGALNTCPTVGGLGNRHAHRHG